MIAFIIYRIVNKERHISREKPLWKKLIYWEVILFLSIIFNIILYTSNTSIYGLPIHINSETLGFIIFLAASCLIIQLLSPSMPFGKLAKSIKKLIKNHASKKNTEKLVIAENISNVNISTHKKLDIYPIEDNTICPDNSKDFQEKAFELFLNTLCILSFSFVIFLNIFFSIIPSAFGSLNSEFVKYKSIPEQMNCISCILLLFTLSTAIRQTIFYLIKLRKYDPSQNANKENNSPQYERYMLVQKHLNKANEKL